MTAADSAFSPFRHPSFAAFLNRARKRILKGEEDAASMDGVMEALVAFARDTAFAVSPLAIDNYLAAIQNDMFTIRLLPLHPPQPQPPREDGDNGGGDSNGQRVTIAYGPSRPACAYVVAVVCGRGGQLCLDNYAARHTPYDLARPKHVAVVRARLADNAGFYQLV